MFSMILVYLFLTIPKLSFFFGWLIVAAVIGTVLGLLITALAADAGEDTKPYQKMAKRFAIAAVVLGLAHTLVPSKETSYAMAAAYVAQEAVQSELGQSAIALLQANVNEALAELKNSETKK